MLRNGVGMSVPHFTILIAPVFSTMKMPLTSLGGAVTYKGLLRPLATRCDLIAVPDTEVIPAQTSPQLPPSNRQMAEHPSPSTTLASSHSSPGSVTPLPQAAVVHTCAKPLVASAS